MGTDLSKNVKTQRIAGLTVGGLLRDRRVGRRFRFDRSTFAAPAPRSCFVRNVCYLKLCNRLRRQSETRPNSRLSFLRRESSISCPAGKNV